MWIVKEGKVMVIYMGCFRRNSMDYSEQIGPYKHVSNFQWVWRCSWLKFEFPRPNSFRFLSAPFRKWNFLRKNLFSVRIFRITYNLRSQCSSKGALGVSHLPFSSPVLQWCCMQCCAKCCYLLTDEYADMPYYVQDMRSQCSSKGALGVLSLPLSSLVL
jgi:hypothetical protein